MNRINNYQENVLKFLKTKSLGKFSDKSQYILNEELATSDHMPAILCLTILNNQCKKNNLKIHGYYIASAVDIMMITAKICTNRDFFDMLYGHDNIDNMITEATNMMYWSVVQNVETLLLNRNDHNSKTLQRCVECCVKFIPRITQRNINHSSELKMKHTDIYQYKFPTGDYLEKYKKKTRLDVQILKQEIANRYGGVCSMATCLGWLLGQGNETVLPDIEKLGYSFGWYIKLVDDFKYLERDVQHSKISTNFVVNQGIKSTYSTLMQAKIDFIEGTLRVHIDSKTIHEIIENITKTLDELISNISVDMATQYSDCSDYD